VPTRRDAADVPGAIGDRPDDPSPFGIPGPYRPCAHHEDKSPVFVIDDKNPETQPPL
jgi:hypothetical protein